MVTRRSLPLAAICLGLVVVACHEVARPLDPSDRMRDVTLPPGTELEQACVPTGPELCFNAKDDNCNGVIDEGCGVRTGVLQFSIAWGEATADVDLEVTDPEGDLASTEGVTRAGLAKDRDCPNAPEGCQGQNVENVFLAESEPRAGRYRVVVRLESPGEATPPIAVQLGVRIGQRTFSLPLTVSPGRGRDEQAFEFTL